MKLHVVALLLLMFTSLTYAQISKITDFEKKMKAKVETGMSTDEVKKVLGRPKAVEGGFPDEASSFITEYPEQKGQLNYTTWFYAYPMMTVMRDQPAGFKVNGEHVEEDDYNLYKDLDMVYYYEGKVIGPSMGKSYADLKNPNLVIKSKDPSTTMVVKSKKKVPQNLMPVVCVIFDKGTQVVADTKVFFKLE